MDGPRVRFPANALAFDFCNLLQVVSLKRVCFVTKEGTCTVGCKKFEHPP
ncbi:hypothetical protein WAI453_012612 [Rhynchosporium graminicola]